MRHSALGGYLTDEDIHNLTHSKFFGEVLSVFGRYSSSPPFFFTALYLWLLVGIAGQSFGMMITGLRVVTTDFRSPGLLRSLWRYLIVFFLWWLILLWAPFSRRIMLHDRWSGTRLIRAETIMARAAGVATR